MPDMALGYPSSDLFDDMFGIVFFCHVCRQKADKLYACYQLPNFGKRGFTCW